MIAVRSHASRISIYNISIPLSFWVIFCKKAWLLSDPPWLSALDSVCFVVLLLSSPSSTLPFSGVLFPAFVLAAFLVALSVFELSLCCLSINCVLDYAPHESSHALIRLDLFTLRFISVAVPAWASKKDLRTFCLPLFRHETQATFSGLFRVCSILP